MKSVWHCRTLRWLTLGPVLGVVLGLGACSTSGSSGPPTVSPIRVPPSPETHVGKMVWRDLLTHDLSAAREFYGALFGWDFGSSGTVDRPYWSVELDGRLIAGAFQVDPAEVEAPMWIVSVSVDDVDGVTGAARELEASVPVAPTDLPGRGRYSVVADRQGGYLALLRSNTGDPPDGTEIRSGDWVWTELWTPDATDAASFYSKLLRYRSDLVATRMVRSGGDASAEVPESSQAESVFFVLYREEKPRAGVQQLPQGYEPYWLPYVAVAEVDAIVRKARDLGATVLLAPEDVRDGEAAILVDPQGAPFGVQRWPRTGGVE